jgi:hypothetical protein
MDIIFLCSVVCSIAAFIGLMLFIITKRQHISPWVSYEGSINEMDDDEDAIVTPWFTLSPERPSIITPVNRIILMES